MGIEPFLVTSSVNAILAQRLIRRLCKGCREPFEPDEESLNSIGITQDMLANRTLYRNKGCSSCQQTGYKGREGIFELMVIDDEMQSLILKTSDANAIKKLAVEHGMLTLRRDGARKVLEGITTIEEVFRVTEQ
jgi:general secretion pathway protein E